jgi:hypothetical protein
MSRFNRNGILIMEQRRPPETFYIVFDGIADNFKGVKYRPSTVPSRLKSDSQFCTYIRGLSVRTKPTFHRNSNEDSFE